MLFDHERVTWQETCSVCFCFSRLTVEYTCVDFSCLSLRKMNQMFLFGFHLSPLNSIRGNASKILFTVQISTFTVFHNNNGNKVWLQQPDEPFFDLSGQQRCPQQSNLQGNMLMSTCPLSSRKQTLMKHTSKRTDVHMLHRILGSFQCGKESLPIWNTEIH